MKRTESTTPSQFPESKKAKMDHVTLSDTSGTLDLTRPIKTAWEYANQYAEKQGLIVFPLKKGTKNDNVWKTPAIGGWQKLTLEESKQLLMLDDVPHILDQICQSNMLSELR